jgi:hypothetical protein
MDNEEQNKIADKHQAIIEESEQLSRVPINVRHYPLSSDDPMLIQTYSTGLSTPYAPFMVRRSISR